MYCHWDDCKDNPLEDIKDDMTEDGGYLFHRFITNKISITVKKTKTNAIPVIPIKYYNNLTFNDLNRMISELVTEMIDEKLCLTIESQQLLVEIINKTMVFITDSGKDYFYIYRRIYDLDTKSSTLDFIKRPSELIFKNKDSLGIGFPQYSETCKIKSLGKFIEYMVPVRKEKIDEDGNCHVIKRYDNVIFYPYYKKEIKIPYTFNVFKGFNIKRLIDIDDEKEEYIENDDYEKSYTYKHIVDNICNGDKELAKYTHNWIAHLLQYPQKKPEVCLVLYSRQGAGKDRFSKFVGNLIGSNYFQVYKSLTNFNSNFNVSNKNKLLCVLNEVDAKSSFKIHDELKHIITRDQLVFSVCYDSEDERVANHGYVGVDFYISGYSTKPVIEDFKILFYTGSGLKRDKDDLPRSEEIVKNKWRI